VAAAAPARSSAGWRGSAGNKAPSRPCSDPVFKQRACGSLPRIIFIREAGRPAARRGLRSAAGRHVFVLPFLALTRGTYRLAALRFGDLQRGPRFSWMRTLRCITPSAVLPAGERILAGRCPAPSRSAAANRARRRRPLSHVSRRLMSAPSNENGALNVRAHQRAGINFSRTRGRSWTRTGKCGEGKCISPVFSGCHSGANFPLPVYGERVMPSESEASGEGHSTAPHPARISSDARHLLPASGEKDSSSCPALCRASTPSLTSRR
jgi:hypothetical protein